MESLENKMSNCEIEARNAMLKHNLRPVEDATGSMHHTDFPFTDEDQEIAELAYWLGGIFTDKEGTDPDTKLRFTYWYSEMSSIDIWRRVARALRMNGLRITNRD